MPPVLRCRDLGKRYKFYARPVDRLLEWVRPSAGSRHEDFWALRNVSFDVHAGECLGVIGPNGAGKSTLLKILAGAATPNEGHFEATGRILALLELGTGFSPELTGRANIAYVTALLGYEAAEVTRRTPAIIEFAGLGEFIDHPVRTYSSGMFVRLAFSVYAGLDPDILIVDEALAVGDAGFQRRCLRRIEELRDRHRTAIVLVTHDMALVSHFCHRALVLHHGRVLFDGASRDAIEVTHGILFQQQEIPSRRPDDSIAYGDGAAEFVDIWVEDQSGRRTDAVGGATPVTFCYRVQFHTTVQQPILGMRLVTVQGIVLSSTNTQMLGVRTGLARPGDVWEIRWHLNPRLTPGYYFLSCGCSYLERNVFLCRKVDALKLTVIGAMQTAGFADFVHAVEVRSLDGGSTLGTAS